MASSSGAGFTGGEGDTAGECAGLGHWDNAGEASGLGHRVGDPRSGSSRTSGNSRGSPTRGRLAVGSGWVEVSGVLVI